MVESTKIVIVVCTSIGHRRKIIKYDIKQGKKFQKPVLEFMIKKNYITQHSNYLCTDCYKEAQRLTPDLKSSSQKENEHGTTTGSKSSSDSNVDTDNNKDQLDIDTIVGLLIDKLESSCEEIHVPYKRWAKLISLIGFKIINPQIYKEVLELNMMYKDYQSLKNISFDHYICQRDKCLVAFLESISGIAFNKERNNQVKYSICSIIESVYYLRNLNLVLPYSFLFNIVESLISGSKPSQQ